MIGTRRTDVFLLSCFIMHQVPLYIISQSYRTDIAVFYLKSKDCVIDTRSQRYLRRTVLYNECEFGCGCQKVMTATLDTIT